MDDHTVSYDEHKAFLDKQVDGAIWERRGFVDAKILTSPVLPDGEYEATRYKQGYYAGQIKLMLEQVTA